MPKIDASSWKEFKLDELFVSSNGDFDIKKEHISGLGVDVITAGETDNGILGKTDVDARIFPGNTITVDMFGRVAYRSKQYKMVTHARVFSLSCKYSEFDEKSGLFFVTTIQKLLNGFSYSNMCSWKKIKEEVIKLPVTEIEEIDWDYMQEHIQELEQERIQELEQERIQELEQYLMTTGLNDYKLTDEEQISLNFKPKFRSFKLSSTYVKRGKLIEVDENGLFDIAPTKKKINANNITFNGRYPYVARGDNYNGIRGYINFDEQYLNPKNSISFGQDTATMHYQPNDYFTGDKIQVFKLNASYGILTENIALYLISSMKKSFANYVWGQQSFCLEAIAEMPVELPVDASGNIDFKYMNQYVQTIKKATIKDVVEWKNKVISATKEIVGNNH